MSREELVEAYRAGKISRRDFVKRMAVVGGTVAAVFGGMGVAEAHHKDGHTKGPFAMKPMGGMK